ncbi:MAG: enoyl-CoA hydratase-related protein [Proteobacteria bacterium]|nr:enoyl-CoA hydratase-related protein [Pseudomonadota bacterium]
MNDAVIKVEKKGPIAVLTINRPKTLNALDIPAILELESAFAALEEDDDIRVVVFTGAGDRAFVAGGDIADLNSREGLAHYREFAEVVHRAFRRIECSDKPTIAAVNGWALGGGTELLLAIDMRILADSARLGLPEITLGLFPGAGGTQRILRQVPLCRAKEIMFTGEHIDAATAVAIGLANRAVPKEDLMAETMKLAERIATMSPLVLKMLKRTLNAGADMALSAALQHEQAMVSLVLDSQDAHEGCSAFLEKRPADFKGA